MAIAGVILVRSLDRTQGGFMMEIMKATKSNHSISVSGAVGMTQPCNKPLRTNPFHTYRDPKTGQWVVIQLPQNLAHR